MQAIGHSVDARGRLSLSLWKCRPMIIKLPLFQGLNIRLPIIIPLEGTGAITQGSTLKS